MIYKNIDTGVIGEFEGFPDENWILATEEEINSDNLKKAKEVKTAQCLAYLQQTDWYITRMSDPTSKKSLKEGVAKNRALARSLQDEIEACETLEELKTINFNF